MASWRERGQRLYLASSYRKDGRVKTRYLRTWGTVQEAVADLGDARIVAALKAHDKNIDVAKLRLELEKPVRFNRVPRHAQSALRAATGRAAWDGVIEWDLGRPFWKQLASSMIEKIGLADLSGLDAVHEFGGEDDIKAFRAEVEAAARDLQRRLLRRRKDASGGQSPSRADLRDAAETLLLDEPLERLTVKAVKKKFKFLARRSHPDLSPGQRDEFERQKAARDLLVSHLELRPKGR